MKDRVEREEFRSRVQATIDDLQARSAEPAEKALWKPFIEQLKVLMVWTGDDRLPSLDELNRITVGHMALRELGENVEDVPEKWLEPRDALMTIQDDVMNFYDPFP